jgi:hypothetical protein
MKLISCQNGRIFTSLQSEEEAIARQKTFYTGVDAFDELLPDGGIEQGAIHEMLSMPEHGSARTFAFFLASSGSLSLREREKKQTPHPDPLPKREGTNAGAIIWADPDSELYPPALVTSGIPLEHLYLLRPASREDLIWSITECLRCKGVAVTVAQVDRLSRIEARRLQLAAERGGGMGILLRSMLRARGEWQAPPIYAAATRWLVAPILGERTVQRWNVTLIHGHGGRVGKTVILEHCRETNLMRAAQKLADRPMETIAKTA